MGDAIYSILSIVLVAVLLLAVLSIVYMSWRNGISPMPSSVRVRREVMKELERLPGRGLFIEAGSGWGTLALQVARSRSEWTIVGLENSIIPLWAARFAAWIDKQTNLSYVRKDLYTCSYEDAQMVVCYLYPGAMLRLGPILRKQLAPGAQVISMCFALPGWEPERVITCTDVYRTKVYVYRA